MNEDISEQLAALEKVHENFRLVVGANGTAEGSLRKGYAICSTCGEGATPQEGQVVITTVIPPDGACCLPNGTCETRTEAACIADGGTWQGAGVLCEDVECPSTGACCDDDCGCTETTREGCPGLWMPGADCDPNPCPGGWYCSLYEISDYYIEYNDVPSSGYCQGHLEFWSHDNCFGGDHVLEICTGTDTVHCNDPECHIERVWEEQLDGTCNLTTVSHEPPGCVCNCSVCVCACGPDDCCFFNDSSPLFDCGDAGFTRTIHSGADCTNGFNDAFEYQVECHYPC